MQRSLNLPSASRPLVQIQYLRTFTDVQTSVNSYGKSSTYDPGLYGGVERIGENAPVIPRQVSRPRLCKRDDANTTHSYWATVVVASPDDAARREGDVLRTASSKILDTYLLIRARSSTDQMAFQVTNSRHRICDSRSVTVLPKCTDVTAFNWLQYRRSA